MKREFTKAVSCCVFMMGIALVAGRYTVVHAQVTRIVQGELLDRSGKRPIKYTVKLDGVGANAGKDYSADTDYSGTFQFINVPPGDYVIHTLDQPSGTGRTIRITEQKFQSIPSIRWNASAVNIQEIMQQYNPAAYAAMRRRNRNALEYINIEAAKTINPAAAAVIDCKVARVINPEAARVLSASGATCLKNVMAAKVLIPEKASTLTKDSARRLTPESAIHL